MGLPRVRFTVRRIMVTTATLAVSWALFIGIAHLIVYLEHSNEQYYREGAAILEAKKFDVLAAESRRTADEMARMNQEGWSRVVTFLGLTGMGGISAGLGLVLRARGKTAHTASSEPANALASACLTVTKIIVVGLALAGITYIGFILLVLAGTG